MRLTAPRIKPKEKENWDEEDHRIMKPFVESRSVHNVFKTLLQHPSMMKRWMVFANHILFKSTLSFRDRELVILRVGYLCEAGYEWAQHEVIGRKAGLDDAGINSAIVGPNSPGLCELDRLLLTATDELIADTFIQGETWDSLLVHLNEQQVVDLIFTVGQYNLVSMALNTLGVQLDEGLSRGAFRRRSTHS
jgi:4-carboxymuconolactone decarboxylase